MTITEVTSGKELKIIISPIELIDFKSITKKRYFFDWKLEKKYEIYKVTIREQSEILGLVSFEFIPEEWRIHIRLISVSVENKGKGKIYDGIVGNLLTHISKLAIKEFAELACVSLKPKGAIAQHYIDEYGMNITGATLSLELGEILALIEKFDK
jgi:hypothetical protein